MRAWLGLGLGMALAFAASAGATGSPQHARQHGAPSVHEQSYAGQQYRAVASFSDEEIADLREGRGMGLARPAELNGYPGPMHVLELASELSLTAEQRSAVEAVFARMRKAAQAAGARYLEAESAVDAAFRSGGAGPEQISALVREADSARADVRLAHLKAHLQTAPILSAEQRRRYAELRGYADSPGGQHHPHSHRERAK